MATIEQLETVTEAWDRLSSVCDEAACCPTLKAEEVLLFRKMADSFKGILDQIEPKYWKADGEGMLALAADFDELADKVRQAIRVSGDRADGIQRSNED